MQHGVDDDRVVAGELAGDREVAGGQRVGEQVEEGADRLLVVARFGVGRSSAAGSYEGYGVFYGESRGRMFEALDVILAESDRELSVVLHFQLSDEMAEQRLLKRALEQGREDDTPEIIHRRMETMRIPEELVEYQRLVKEALGSVVDAGKKSDAQTMAMSAGKANVMDVVTAVAETDVAVSTLVSVRDRMIQSYEDIMKMPI